MSRMLEVVRLQKDVLYDWKPTSIRFGDLLRRTTHWGLIDHYAVAISSRVCVEFGPAVKNPNLLRLIWGVLGKHSIRDITIEDRCVHEAEDVEFDSYRMIRDQLMAAFPAFHKADEIGYSLLGNNCEHQARAVTTGSAICTQVPTWWGQRNTYVEQRLLDFMGRTIVSPVSVKNYTK